jgi:hypothetical protein
MKFKQLFRPISDVMPGVCEQPIRTENVAKFCLGCSHKELLAWLDRHPAEFFPHIQRVFARKGKNRWKYPHVRLLYPSEVIRILDMAFGKLPVGYLHWDDCPRCWGTGQDLRLAPRIKRGMKIFMGLKQGKVA